MEQYSPSHVVAPMTDKQFARLSGVVTSELGIKLAESKKTMLQTRLQKRLRALGLSSYSQYCDHLFKGNGMEQERPFLYDVVTTNTTHFFREPKHFEILTASVLPDLAPSLAGQRLRLWSAGCSSGEEPYTLAMVMLEYARSFRGFDFEILATDISTQVLQHGSRGVYDLDKANSIPGPLVKKYLLRSKNPSQSKVKMGDELRSRVKFRRLNFMKEFSFKKPMDIIFCRNVVIYFDRAVQEKLFKKFCSQLGLGGYLFIGHSESITGMGLPVNQLAPTVYKRV